MIVALIVFLFVAALVVGGFFAATHVPGAMERRRVELRLKEITRPGGEVDEALVVRPAEGPVPVVEKLIGRTRAGSRLSRLIEQSGVNTTPSALGLASLVCAAIFALLTEIFVRISIAHVVTIPLGASLPFLWILHRRSSRFRTFEEHFPDALDLISRAIRSGHAFQTAIGMAAEELAAPVGPEFRKVFDQQNFGLPLKEALNGLADRVPILDVKFFITAVAIQRESGGNLAEILDNLAHVVRERFKIHRQVRVHTAHGRITGLVLLALPPFLAIALSVINADHMKPLFQEHIGQMMILATIVMQIVGFFWIRQVIKIEV